MMIPIAGNASPFMWLPFVGYFAAVLAAIWAVLRESPTGDVTPEEDRQSDQQ